MPKPPRCGGQSERGSGKAVLPRASGSAHPGRRMVRTGKVGETVGLCETGETLKPSPSTFILRNRAGEEAEQGGARGCGQFSVRAAHAAQRSKRRPLTPL